MRPEPDSGAITSIAIDLDGTMVDSAPDLAAAAGKMLQSLGLDSLPQQSIRGMIGDGIDTLVLRCLQAGGQRVPGSEEVARAGQLMRKFYEEDVFSLGSVYPGVIEALRRWQARGMVLACITNKASQLTHRLLREASLDGYFAGVYCADKPEQRKPAPALLLQFMQDHPVEARSCVMIGDSSHDMLAAQAAGVRAVAVTYGYGNPQVPQAMPWRTTARLDALVLEAE